MEREAFGGRLKRLRLERGLSQRKLAAAAELTNGAISQAEDGQLWVDQLPSYDIMRRLAQALGVTMAFLAGDEPERTTIAPESDISPPAMRVIPGPWFDIAEAMGQDAEFAATGQQILEIRRTQTPEVAAEAEAELFGAMRRNARMWRRLWKLGLQAGKDRNAIEDALAETEEPARDDGE